MLNRPTSGGHIIKAAQFVVLGSVDKGLPLAGFCPDSPISHKLLYHLTNPIFPDYLRGTLSRQHQYLLAIPIDVKLP